MANKGTEFLFGATYGPSSGLTPELTAIGNAVAEQTEVLVSEAVRSPHEGADFTMLELRARRNVHDWLLTQAGVESSQL